MSVKEINDNACPCCGASLNSFIMQKISACQTMRDALRLCWQISDISLEDLANDLGVLSSHLSNMLGNKQSRNRYFPPEKINQLMDVCQNEIPLHWLAFSRGYGLFRLKSEVEAENERLKEELRKVDKKLETIQEFLKSVKGL